VKSNTADRIRARCAQIADMLVEKNRSYGDSALRPVGIFAVGRAEDLIRVRLDDKLSRIRNAPDTFGEDAVTYLIGYLSCCNWRWKTRRMRAVLESNQAAPLAKSSPVLQTEGITRSLNRPKLTEA
jgi:hypothetical protein